MKVIAFLMAVIVVTSCLGESRASGIGGIYGQEQRNRVGRGKVIESIENEKINTNNPKSSVESVSHRGKPKENYNDEDRSRILVTADRKPSLSSLKVAQLLKSQ
ncbi:hypothetical protein RJT34_19789 [Clitoria ternatea]|uniref:Uncharacterized protein n=1 Tax=Clitoria ternatea TaxID=43366 RepID=A0AAN9P497_CLITE